MATPCLQFPLGSLSLSHWQDVLPRSVCSVLLAFDLGWLPVSKAPSDVWSIGLVFWGWSSADLCPCNYPSYLPSLLELEKLNWRVCYYLVHGGFFYLKKLVQIITGFFSFLISCFCWKGMSRVLSFHWECLKWEQVPKQTPDLKNNL